MPPAPGLARPAPGLRNLYSPGRALLRADSSRYGTGPPIRAILRPTMGMPPIALEGASIVFIGSFNPAIFHPSWYVAEGLWSKTEMENAEVGVITADICSFRTEQYALHALNNRFMISTTQVPLYDSLRDLAVGTFKILRHTPLAKLGLNREVHFQLDSEEVWHAIEQKLAPKEHWQPILKNPGMRALTIEGMRPDNLDGAVHVRVEPSNRIENGLFVEVNDHFEVDDTLARSAKAIRSIAQEQWTESLRRSDDIIQHIGSLC